MNSVLFYSMKVVFFLPDDERPRWNEVAQSIDYCTYRDKNVTNFNEIAEFCKQVDVILLTVSDSEFQAATTFMDPPKTKNIPKVIENYPEDSMVLGLFAGKKTALVQTPQGSKCRKKVSQVLQSFPRAHCIILVGVCYAFDREKHKLGDVLVSSTITDMINFKVDMEIPELIRDIHRGVDGKEEKSVVQQALDGNIINAIIKR